MPYLLDGNNLIGLVRRSSRPAEEDRRALVAEIADRLRRSRARAVLYFDGAGDPRSAALGSLEVRGATGSNADEAIVRDVARASDPASMIVVTADRELQRRVREAGGKTCPPKEFFDRFGSRAPAGGSPKSGEQVDVEEWTRYFEDERNRTRK
jgi:rRNA-processing protein FCF1